MAGGNKLEFQHGQHLKGSKDTPLTNLHQTVLNRMEVPVTKFSDSTGELEGI